MAVHADTENAPATPVVVLVANEAGQFIVPKSSWLFNADFERNGADLYILNDGAPRLYVKDYFAENAEPDLVDPQGAILRGKLVALMAGPLAPGQYAQTGEGVGSSPIGQVEVLSGVATVQRVDGTVEVLQLGVKIFEKDVLQTEGGASVSVTFVDGTIFSLASGSRMVIDELIYDPAGSDNSGGFDLIQGSFVFIAGQVAKTGGIEVATPSSTMGIRGTTVVVEVASEDGVTTTEVTLTTDPNGDTGRVLLRDLEGNLIADIVETNTKWIVSTVAGETREVERTALDNLEDNVLIAEAFAAFRAAVARVDAGDTFVSLSDPAPSLQGTQDGTNEDGGFDVDTIDEPDSIDQPDQLPEPPDTNDIMPFDEGLNQLAPEDAQIVVQGLEDASGTMAIVGSAANAVDGEGPFVFALESGPENGSAVLNSDGSFTFEPLPDFNGSDSFRFSATDAQGRVTEGTVLVEVLPVNDQPTGSDGVARTSEDTVFSGALNFQDVDGDPLDFSVSDAPSFGEVLLLRSGMFTYTPGLNFVGSDSFTVVATDPFGAEATSTVTVSVTGVDDAPVIVTIPGRASGALAEGAEIIDAFGQLAATDADIGDVVTWSGESQAQFGTFQISPDGAWSYQLNNALADPLKAGQTVVERLQAVAQDLSGLRTFQTVEVLLTGTNDVPILRINSVFDTVEDTSVVAALSSFDLDGAPGELTYSAGADGPDDGVVSIVSDGTFTYTPNLGFAGFDRFEYVVQDAAGGVSSAFATIAVQSDPDAQDESQVSVTLNREASSDASAGSLGIDIQGTTVASVNLAFVLDSSGSIGRTAWAEMLSNVRTSVQNLSALFEGSDTSVDVQIIPFSARAEPTAVYDISDPALINVIDPSVLDFIGRGTSWTRAFQAAGDLFFNEPANEPNFLLFVTDGRPSDGAWVEPFGELTDTSDDYDVSISAFGFGPRFEPGTLSDVDANAVVLSGPNDLSEAFAATPVFNPELIGLTVELLADDSPSVVIADETSPALLVEESDFELPLASIENIVDMLGDENRVSITALFDLNGDTSSAEIRIFTSEVIGKAENAQNASGLAGDDLLFGSESSDTIMGAGGNDVILAFEGDDILTGGAGADKIRAGDGADRLILGELAESGDDFDGGAGRDTLVIDVAGDINALIAALDLSNTEVIDADNSLANSMTLTYEDVAGFSETDDTELQELLDAALPNAHSVLGDGDDSIVLDGAGTYSVQMTGSVVDGAGNTLELYTFSLSPGNALATLGIEADVDVSTTNTVVVS